MRRKLSRKAIKHKTFGMTQVKKRVIDDSEIIIKVNYCEEDGDRVRYNPTPRNIRYKIKSRQVSKESRTSNEN